MKKWIAVVVISLCSFVPASAQQLGPYNINITPNPTVENFFKSLVIALGVKDVPWVSQVHSAQLNLLPSGPVMSELHPLSTTDFESKPVDPAIKNAYNVRFHLLQKAITKNHTLAKYTLVAPEPKDLVQPSQADIEYVLSFLAQPRTEDDFNAKYTPISVSQPERGVTEVKLKNQNTLILRIDSLKKKVFFFLNSYKN